MHAYSLLFIWCLGFVCLCELYSCSFNNDDGLTCKVMVGIEPVFPHEHVPLMLKGMTSMHLFLEA